MGIIRIFGRRSKRNYFLFWSALIIIFILYTEYYTYQVNSLGKNLPVCNERKSCVKILLVADPQIIGHYNEKWHYLTPLSIYDSDRYLRKTFKYAFDIVDPDVVIFLGDIMDEGSTAVSDQEFNGYVRRVFNIFSVSSTNVRHIWIPGDNDIGGEGTDRVAGYKIRRFDRAFMQPDLITIKNYTFFKINVMTQTIPVYKQKREFYDVNQIFIGLSHMPLMYLPTMFVDKVLSKMLPQLLFTAHEHKSMIVSTDALLRADRQIVPINPEDNTVYEYELGVSDMYEVIVPTCSYRMGTDKIGFGYAVLEKNILRYTVLWSPSRFEQLRYYVIFLVCFVISTFCFCYCRMAYKQI